MTVAHCRCRPRLETLRIKMGPPTRMAENPPNAAAAPSKSPRPKRSASRVLAALASPLATKALDPDPFPCRSLRHAVYAALLHFGLESAIDIALGTCTQ